MANRHLRSCMLLGVAVALGLTFTGVQAGGKRSDSEVKINVKAGKPDAAGKVVISIDLDINKGWHIYSNPVGNDDLDGAKTEVKVSGKAKPASVKIDYPTPHVIDDKVLGKYGVYEDKVTIRATVIRAPGDTEPLEVSIKFQACNDRGSCLFPSTVKKSVP